MLSSDYLEGGVNQVLFLRLSSEQNRCPCLAVSKNPQGSRSPYNFALWVQMGDLLPLAAGTVWAALTSAATLQ